MHTASAWTRQILRGVATFAHEVGGWEFHLEPRGYYEKVPIPSNWDFDGVITRLTHSSIESALLAKGVPVVNVSWLGQHSAQIVKVNSDQQACAELAARHLSSRGLTRLAFFGPAVELGYGETTINALNEFAIANNLHLEAFVPPNGSNAERIARLRRELADWLRKQPTPMGIVAWDSFAGYELSVACSLLDLRIPEDVAVVCIEHDNLTTSLSPQPLSCVDQNPLRVGFESAKVLAELMDGKEISNAPRIVPPLGVVARQSTDIQFVQDELVAKSIAFIRENLAQPLQVADVQRQFSVSRRQLEVRFKSAVGEPPGSFLRRARLEYASRLLSETVLSTTKIAALCGFSHPEVMIRAFKREYGRTPGEVRGIE